MIAIATNQTNCPILALVYAVNDDFITAKHGSMWTESETSAEKAKPRNYKLYFDIKRDDYFWNWQGWKFYLSETMRSY